MNEKYLPGFYVILIYLNKFHSFLLGSNTFPFLIRPYKMTAIKESRFLSNKIQVVVCMKKQVLRLVQSNIGDIFFTGSAVIFTEQFCKIRITHVTHFRKLMNLQRFSGMRVNILQNMIKRKIRIGIKCNFFDLGKIILI